MIIPVTPVTAPRQVQSDKWKLRPAVKKYRDFRDEISLYAHAIDTKRPLKIIFWMPFPKGYSKTKREILAGHAHKIRPDLDNLIKALADSVHRFDDDSHIWSIHAEKRWTDGEGRIEIEPLLGVAK